MLLLCLVLIVPLSAGPVGEDEEDWGGLPPGGGRETTYHACNACHSTMLVAQQRLARDIWDETLDYMVAEHGMDALAPAERKEILDYLSTRLSEDTPR